MFKHVYLRNPKSSLTISTFLIRYREQIPLILAILAILAILLKFDFWSQIGYPN